MDRKNSIFFGLIATVLLLIISNPLSAQNAPNLKEFKKYDLDKFVRGVKVPTDQGIDIFPAPDPLFFEGVLSARPFLWSEGEHTISFINKAMKMPWDGKNIQYGMDVISKKGKRIRVHLQNITALSILDQINQEGDVCCVGNKIEFYIRHLYTDKDGPGLVAVWVLTHRRGEKSPPG